jgi:hypothetical protein
MDDELLVEADTLAGIVVQKLQGIINKMDIVSETDEDKWLADNVGFILREEQSVLELLKESLSHESG